MGFCVLHTFKLTVFHDIIKSIYNFSSLRATKSYFYLHNYTATILIIQMVRLYIMHAFIFFISQISYFGTRLTKLIWKRLSRYLCPYASGYIHSHTHIHTQTYYSDLSPSLISLPLLSWNGHGGWEAASVPCPTFQLMIYHYVEPEIFNRKGEGFAPFLSAHVFCC